jgi:hypothetical protein
MPSPAAAVPVAALCEIGAPVKLVERRWRSAAPGAPPADPRERQATHGLQARRGRLPLELRQVRRRNGLRPLGAGDEERPFAAGSITRHLCSP